MHDRCQKGGCNFKQADMQSIIACVQCGNLISEGITLFCCDFSFIKAMKSSPILRPFGDLKFCRFFLLKIKIGWVLSCIKVQICKQS